MRPLGRATVGVAVLLGLVLTPVTSAASVRHRGTGHRAGSAAPVGLRQRLTAYADSRRGSISVAVYDDTAHRLIRVHHQDRMVTASIVKVDILQTLLHLRHGRLSEDERGLATRMIEQSDNDAASDLWDDVGGAPGISRYNAKLGLHQTHPHGGGRWGLTRTSATDQVTLVRALSGHSPLLSASSQQFARRLMRDVTRAQRWGISAGPDARAVIGLKNGWLPVESDHDRWAVNSIGWVRGTDRRYQIAVLTAHQPSEGYGIQTVEELSRLVWAHVSRAGSRHG